MALKKSLIFFVFILIGFLIGYQYKQYQFIYKEKVPFIPTVADTTRIGVNYHSNTVLLEDEEFKDNLVRLLEHYGKDYSLLDGNIYIDKKLSNDYEMLVNYTEKAKRGFVPSTKIIYFDNDDDQREYLRKVWKDRYPEHYESFNIPE